MPATFVATTEYTVMPMKEANTYKVELPLYMKILENISL
jgi:hypothetical protein